VTSLVLLDALDIASAVLVGHDWGAAHAWNAALMRPDRFRAVFGLSVPYVPRADVSTFERIRKSGHANDFYMFAQMRPGADQIWADAAVTIPGVLYWASGSARSTSGAALWIRHEACIVRLPGRCPRGRNQIASLTTSLNSSVPDFTVP
jgi:pimeloyl-ACP methyl ester carboxylesterase